MIQLHKLFFVFLFFCLAVSQWSCKEKKLPPKVIDGEIDLRKWYFETDGELALDGNWQFIWNKFVDSKNYNDEKDSAKNFVEVPGLWNGLKYRKTIIPKYGIATYKLHVILNKAYSDLAIKMLGAATASEYFIDSTFIGNSGIIGKTPEKSLANYKPKVLDIPVTVHEFDIFVKVSNFHHKKGGMWESLVLGTRSQIRAARESDISFEYFLLGSILIMALYHLGLYFIRKGDISPLYFSLFCFALVVRISVTGEHIINNFIDMNWEWMVKLEYLSFYWAAPFFAMFTNSLFPKEFSKKAVRFLQIFCGIYTIWVLVTPVRNYSYGLIPYQLVCLLAGLYIIYTLILALIRRRDGARAFTAGWIVLFVSIINDVLYQNQMVYTGNMVYLGLFIFIFFQAFLLSVRFSRAFQQTERLTTELNYTNKNLEKIVEERTAEVIRQKDDLQRQHQLLIEKNNQVEKQNKQITASINYASRIQLAILPPEKFVSNLLPQNFIIYKPKQIVSGDFYWIKETSNRIFVAAGDCTGHGVPGAFMSILGLTFLSEIVAHKPLLEAGLILDELRDRVIESLRQTGKRGESQDGMDIAFCVLDLAQRQIQFAGAYNPLFLFHLRNKDEVATESDFTEIRGDRQPIGIYRKTQPFTNHIVPILDNDTFYLFSDGYVDQFGGVKGEKFRIHRLRNLLNEIYAKDMSEQKEIIEETFSSWKGSNAQIDDILMLGVRFSFDN